MTIFFQEPLLLDRKRFQASQCLQLERVFMPKQHILGWHILLLCSGIGHTTLPPPSFFANCPVYFLGYQALLV